MLTVNDYHFDFIILIISDCRGGINKSKTLNKNSQTLILHIIILEAERREGLLSAWKQGLQAQRKGFSASRMPLTQALARGENQAHFKRLKMRPLGAHRAVIF